MQYDNLHRGNSKFLVKEGRYLLIKTVIWSGMTDTENETKNYTDTIGKKEINLTSIQTDQDKIVDIKHNM